MGIFNAGAPFLSDLNLIFQVVIAVVLVLALFAIVRRKYVIHGAMMGCAIVLHTISIFAVMVPSLLSLRSLISGLSTRLSMVLVIHATAGSIAEVLGVLLMLVWVFNRAKVDKCFRWKYIMWATIILWIIELILGTYVYMTLYPFV